MKKYGLYLAMGIFINVYGSDNIEVKETPEVNQSITVNEGDLFAVTPVPTSYSQAIYPPPPSWEFIANDQQSNVEFVASTTASFFKDRNKTFPPGAPVQGIQIFVFKAVQSGKIALDFELGTRASYHVDVSIASSKSTKTRPINGSHGPERPHTTTVTTSIGVPAAGLPPASVTAEGSSLADVI